MPTPTPLPENDPGARIQRAINSNGLTPPLKVDGVCGNETASGLEHVLHYLNGQIATLTKANATSADTIKRVATERDAARALLDDALANREAAEAEAAQLRAELQTGGRLPQLLADLNAAAVDLDRFGAALAAALAKARA